MASNISIGKRELIDKTNSRIVGVIAIAAFLVVFSLIASRALWSQRGYQSRVIDKKEAAVKQLNDNVKAVEDLEVTYKAFVERQDNVIGGSSQAIGDRDGDNAKIVLDALPSKYDYPALVTSLEKILADNGFSLKSISGNDEEIAQTDGGASEPVMMPFELSSEANGYPQVETLLKVLYASIRPIDYKELSIKGNTDSNIEVRIDGFSYYQPSKGLTITKEVVK